MKTDQFIASGDWVPISPGNSSLLLNIPIGTFVHNLESRFGFGGTLVRTSGTKAQILRKIKNYVIIRMPSGELRYIQAICSASIGTILTSDFFKLLTLNKAGRSRWLRKRPIVRGVAKNPIDHPHGGGEGKTSGGRPSVTPWGFLTKGKPTRKKSKLNNLIIRNVRKYHELKYKNK